MSRGRLVAKASKAVRLKDVARAAVAAEAARQALKGQAPKDRHKVAVRAAVRAVVRAVVRADRTHRGQAALLDAINADRAAVASAVGRVAVIEAGQVAAGRVEAEIVVREGSVANVGPAAIRAARRPVQRRAAQRLLVVAAVDLAVRVASLRGRRVARKVAVLAAAVRVAASKAKVAEVAAEARRAAEIRIDLRSSTR